MRKRQMTRHDLYLQKIHVEIETLQKSIRSSKKEIDGSVADDYNLETELRNKFDEWFGSLDDE